MMQSPSVYHILLQLINKIRLCITKTPSINLPLCKIKYQYCFEDNVFVQREKTWLTFNCKSLSELVRLLQIMTICLKNLSENKTITKRNLYYQLNKYYPDYGQIDDDINIICQSLKVKRRQLSILASTKCLIFGRLAMVINDQKFGSISENTLITIPTTATFTISNVQSNTIILIEKESIFHEIKNNKNLQIQGSIIVTAKGYPDVSTRQLLFLLMEFVDHIYYLGDYDVYGFDIFCFYTFGDSQCQGLLSKIHLLPLYPFNSEVYEEALLFPFDKVDEKKAKSILEKSYFKDIPHLSERTQKIQKYKKYFLNFVKEGRKAELQEIIRSFRVVKWLQYLIGEILL